MIRCTAAATFLVAVVLIVSSTWWLADAAPTGNVTLSGPSSISLSLTVPNITFSIASAAGANEAFTLTLSSFNNTFTTTVSAVSSASTIVVPILTTDFPLLSNLFWLNVTSTALVSTSTNISVTVTKIPIGFSAPPVLYLDASPFPVMVSIPPGLAAMMHRTLTIQRVVDNTPPVTLVPTSLTYAPGDLGSEQFFNFSGVSITFNYQIKFVVSGNASMFVYMNNISGNSVENRTVVTLEFVEQQKYFKGTVVDFQASVIWLPAASAGQLYISFVEAGDATVVQIGQINSSTISKTTSGRIELVREGTVSIPVVLSGGASWRYYVQPTQLSFTVRPHLYITTNMKNTSLTSTVNVVTVSLSGPPTISSLVTIHINVSSADVAVSTNQLQWFGGNNDTKSFQFSCSIEGEFTFSFTGASYDSFGAETYEFPGDFRPQAVSVYFSNVLAVTADFPTRMVAQRSVVVPVSVPRVPSGTLIVTFTSIPPTGVTIQPSQLTFNPILADSVTITVTDVTVRTVNITTTLSGSGQSEFERVPMYNITVSPPIKVVTNLPTSLLVGSTVSITVGLGEAPPANSTTTVTLRCLSGVYTILTFSPSDVLTWNGGDTSSRTVATTVVNSTGTSGTYCNWTVVGSGYAQFSQLVLTRTSQNISIVSSASKLYGGESAKLLFNAKFSVIQTTTVSVACVYASGGLCTSQLDKTTMTFVPYGTYNDTVTYTLPDISVSDVVVISFKVTSLTSEFILPADNTLRYNITVVPKRWLRVSGIPALTFAGDNLTISISIQELPVAGVQVRAQVQGFPNTNVVWAGSNTPQTPASKQVVISLTESLTFLFVELAATTDVESNRYQRSITVAIVVKPKLTVTYSAVATSQIVEEPNGQDVVVKISRYPLLSPLRIRGTFLAANAAMLTFEPRELEWRNDTGLSSAPPSASFRIIGLNVGTAVNVSLVLEIDYREVTKSTILMQTSLTLLPLKRITASITPTVSFPGTSSTQYIFLQLSQAPSTASSLTFNLSVSPSNLVSLSRSTLTYTSTTNTSQYVPFTGLLVGAGTLNISVGYGPEFAKTLSGDTSLTVRPLITYTLYSGGVPVTSKLDIVPDVYIEMMLVADESIPGVTRTVVITLELTSCELPTASPHITIQNGTATFSTTKNSHNFRIAAAALSKCVLSLNFTAAATQRQFAAIPPVAINVASLPLLNITGFPSLVVVGSQNAASFTVGAMGGISSGDTLVAELILKACNSTTAASVTPVAPLQWTSSIQAGVKVRVVGLSTAGGTCPVQIAKSSTIFPLQLIYFTGVISMDDPPTVAWLPPTAGTGGVTTLQSGALLVDFRTLQRSAVTLEATVAHNWFLPGGSMRLIYQVEGSPSVEDTADIVAEIPATDQQQPRGFLEISQTGGIPLVLTTPTNTTLRMTLGPISDLLLDNEAVVTLRFEETAFQSTAFPLEGHGSLEFRVTRYVPNIVSLVSTIIIQVAQNGASIASAFTLPTGIVAAQRMYQLGGLVDCPRVAGSDLPLPFGLSIPPTINGFDSNIVVSMVIVAFCGLVFLIHGLAVVGFYMQRKSSSNRTLASLCGRFLFPAISLLPMFYFAQLAMMLMSRVIFKSDQTSNKIGMAILAVIPAVVPPIGIHGVVWRNRSIAFMPNHIQTVDDLPLEDEQGDKKKKRKDKGGGAFKRFFIPSGFWTHTSEPTYLRRYGVLFVEQTEKHKWFLLVEYGVACVIGFIMGIEPASRNGCLAMSAAIAAVTGAYLGGLILWRPFRVPLMNAAMIAVTSLHFVAVCMMTEEQRKEIRNDTVQVFAYRLNIAAEIILLIAVLVRIGIRLASKAEKKAAKDATKQWERQHAKEQLIMEKLIAAHNAQVTGMPPVDRDLAEPMVVDGNDGSKDSQQGDLDFLSLELESLEGTSLFSREAALGEPIGVFRAADGSALTGGEVAFSPSKRRDLAERRVVHNLSHAPFSSRPPEPLPSRRHQVPAPEVIADSDHDSEEAAAESATSSRFHSVEYTPPPKVRWARRRA